MRLSAVALLAAAAAPADAQRPNVWIFLTVRSFLFPLCIYLPAS